MLQTSSSLSPIRIRSPSSMVRSTLHRGIGMLDALCVDACVGEDFVAFLDGRDAPWVCDDLASEDLAGAGESLGVIDVGVGGDDELARREAEIHLPDQLQHVGEFIQEIPRR